MGKNKHIKASGKKDFTNVVFLGLGGNIGNRLENLVWALKELEKNCGKIEKKSLVYETEAWGHDSFNKYLNQVVKLHTKLNAKMLLKQLLNIEKRAGRKRNKAQFSDRILDIDILFFNDEIRESKVLNIPHPRIHLRKFVLVPLNEIAKGFVHPVLKKRVQNLLRVCPDHLTVKPFQELERTVYICVEGNIGAGKTTLAMALAKHLNGTYLPEVFEKNHLLPLFYKKPKTYAFPLEYSFLINRFEQIKTALTSNSEKFVVSDFSIYKSLWFSRISLAKKEYALFKKHFDTFSNGLPKPDLIIVIKTNKNNLLKNILKRGRPYEKAINERYLEEVQLAYNKGTKELEDIKMLEMKVLEFQPDLVKKLIKPIDKYLKENFGYQYQKA